MLTLQGCYDADQQVPAPEPRLNGRTVARPRPGAHRRTGHHWGNTARLARAQRQPERPRSADNPAPLDDPNR